MSKFVKVNEEGSAVLVNMDKVDVIAAEGSGRAVLWMGAEFEEVDESFAEMLKIVGAAQGGIPMEPSKMY